MEVLIVGGGIGGLTLALTLEKAGIPARVFESSPEIKPVGVGINLLPHAMKELARLGLDTELSRVAVETREAVFFNRFGQLIYREPLGRAAGYEWPQFSVHRGDLQIVLLEAVRQRLGNDRVLAGWKCVGFEQDAQGAIALFRSTSTYNFLAGPGYLNLAIGFVQVSAVAGTGGNDAADLYTAPGNNVFNGQGVNGTPSAPGGLLNFCAPNGVIVRSAEKKTLRGRHAADGEP